MDCNKEEALRAKGMAERKMESKDFIGACKFAHKAQKLYPDLENIAQMLIVCNVHCSAAKKLLNNEMDWYGILQIEPTADEATIKKQYRKFALQLHPDKNKFPGAEAAFKLVGEAQIVLLDRDKRMLHDMARRVFMSKSAMSHYPPPNVHMNMNAGVKNNAGTNFTTFNPPKQQSSQPAQQGFNGGRPSFWTACPFCSVKYQYYREVVNRSLRCIKCNRPFVAYDLNVQGAPLANNSSQQAQQNDGLDHGASKVNVGSQGNLNAESSNKEPSMAKVPTSNAAPKNLHGNRRRKRVTESSESSHSVKSTNSEEVMLVVDDGFSGEKNHSANKEENPRRSMRQKQKVSYKENISDDEDDDSPLKKAKGSGLPSGAEVEHREVSKMNETNGFSAIYGTKEVKQKHRFSSEKSMPSRNEELKELKREETVEDSNKTAEACKHGKQDSTSKASKAPNVYVYPDPEFSDFEKGKKEECFAAGQIWAIYDTTDGMPRFYAQITKVQSPEFKLWIKWFEPDPDNGNEMKWVEEKLPVACGKFRLGSAGTENRPVFSHLVSCKKFGYKNKLEVYPRKGETWALFKNWDIKWYADVESHQKYEYEFVEILSDYVEGEGVSVVYLAKLKGFVCLFSQTMKEGRQSFQIPPGELFRFSHRIPSFKMTGQERVDVPVGSFELDLAAVPMNLEEINVPEDLELKAKCGPSGDAGTGSSDRLRPVKVYDNLERSNLAKEKRGLEDDIEDHIAPSVSAPEPQFYNFDAAKSLGKFQIGQIWALYSHEDGLPKYYGMIKQIRTSPNFELHIMRLDSCWLPAKAIMWEEKSMLITCGRFKVKRSSPCVHTNNYSFSHQVHADTDVRNKIYDIFPRKGEVWALYKKWTAKIRLSDLESCEYDIVEVSKENDLWIEVLVLEPVGGFNSVFKGKTHKGSAYTMRIPQTELLRFSHQIPAFKLTEERDGKLRGFWELDPAAFPDHYFGLE